MRTLPLSVLSALTLAAFGLMALGSNSSDTKASSGSPGAAGSAAPGGTEKLAVLATCTVKYRGAIGECTENYGAVPQMAEDMCKGSEGTFAKGATPCPTEGATGKCEFKAKAVGEPGETHFYYPASVGDPKGSCEALGAVWIAMGGAATSAAPASSAAPTKK